MKWFRLFFKTHVFWLVRQLYILNDKKEGDGPGTSGHKDDFYLTSK